MRSRKTLCLVVMLMVAAAGHACTAQAFDINDLNPWIPFSPFQPSRLAAFTARQSLRDSVNIALADGRIDASERFTILTRARRFSRPTNIRRSNGRWIGHRDQGRLPACRTPRRSTAGRRRPRRQRRNCRSRPLWIRRRNWIPRLPPRPRRTISTKHPSRRRRRTIDPG